jgi:hypothetical protein
LNYAVWFTRRGDWHVNRLPALAESVLRPSWLRPGQPEKDLLADSLVRVNRTDVLVGAVKPADLGPGMIVRLFSYHLPLRGVRLTYRGRPIRKAWLCSAREEDWEALRVRGGKALVPLRQCISTVRLVLG